MDALEQRRKALAFPAEWRSVLPLYDALVSRVKRSEAPLVKLSELQEIMHEVDHPTN